jgi:hypothetical protein
MFRRLQKLGILVLYSCVLLLTGCASNPYEYGTGRTQIDAEFYPKMDQQIYVGRPIKFLDAADWIWPGSLLGKLLLWNKDIDSHQISSQTIEHLEKYLASNELNNVQVLVNNYSPGNQWKRLFRNRTVGAGWRYTLGMLSVSFYTILPGRFFGGDAYNPYTNTIYLYSDDASIALHEAGHAKDFGRREYKGTNAAVYALPFAALYYEARASNDALGYLRCMRNTEMKKDAYEILYPAYSTYIGGSFSDISSDPIWLLGVIPGHIAGQIASMNVVSEESTIDSTSTSEDCILLPKPEN